MFCPVCSQQVTADAAACPRCGTNFRAGVWRPVEEHKHFPGPGRIRLHAAMVLVASALLALVVAYASAGPGRFAVQLFVIGLPLFLALSGVGIALVVARAKRRGLNS